MHEGAGETTGSVSRRTAITAVGVLAVAACARRGSTAPLAAGTVLLPLDDLAVGETRVVDQDGRKVAVTRTAEQAVVAHTAVCTHAGCTVGASGSELRCPCHGSAFDPLTGAVRKGPAEEPLAAVAVVVRGKDVVTA